MDDAWLDAAADELARLVDDRLTPGGVLAVRRGDDRTVHAVGRTRLPGPGESGSGEPVDGSTPFWLASATKPIGAVLAQSMLADDVLALDDPIERWLPELTGQPVLVDPTAPLDRTEPAERAPTVSDVLSGTVGHGIAADCFGETPSPLFGAMTDSGVAPGPFSPDLDPDTWTSRLAELPMATQPGRRWRYHLPHDILSVLLERSGGRPLARLLDERVLAPVGMSRTGFGHPAITADQVCDVLSRDAVGDVRVVTSPDPAAPPAFPGLGAGLLSTADDLLALGSVLLDGGGPVLTPSALAAMTTPRLSSEQRTAAAPFLEPGSSWGWGVGVDVASSSEIAGGQLWHSPGRFGWVGGTGTLFYVDPAHELVVVLMTGRLMNGPDDGPTALVRAIVDGLHGRTR